jgi:hypothetical protein
VLDFTSLTLRSGWDYLLTHYLSSGQKLNSRYRDYLSLFVPHLFVKLGANLNRIFYWGLNRRTKTSLWLSYLALIVLGTLRIRLYKGWNQNYNLDVIEMFLDLGAILNDRTIFAGVNLTDRDYAGLFMPTANWCNNLDFHPL